MAPGIDAGMENITKNIWNIKKIFIVAMAKSWNLGIWNTFETWQLVRVAIGKQDESLFSKKIGPSLKLWSALFGNVTHTKNKGRFFPYI